MDARRPLLLSQDNLSASQVRPIIFQADTEVEVRSWVDWERLRESESVVDYGGDGEVLAAFPGSKRDHESSHWAWAVTAHTTPTFLSLMTPR